MSERTKLLGAACGLAAAFITGPAAAATLTDFAADVYSNYGRSSIEHCRGCDMNEFTLGGDVAMPLSDIANLNLQLGAAYTHNWRTRQSQESWDLNGAVFWGGEIGRFGLQANYNTFTHSGYDANFGVFGEMYFGQITVGAAGGKTQSGGSGTGFSLPSGGSGGGYASIFGTVYANPDLAVSAIFDYQQQNHGFASIPTGRRGVSANTYGFEGEYMINEAWSTAVYGNFAFEQASFGGSHQDATVWHIGLRWYTGGGSLENAHRNGTLHPFLSR